MRKLHLELAVLTILGVSCGNPAALDTALNTFSPGSANAGTGDTVTVVDSGVVTECLDGMTLMPKMPGRSASCIDTADNVLAAQSSAGAYCGYRNTNVCSPSQYRQAHLLGLITNASPTYWTNQAASGVYGLKYVPSWGYSANQTTEVAFSFRCCTN